jgi:hypothetical protein
VSRHIRELDLLVAWQGTIESSWKSKAKGQTNCNPKIVLMVFYTGGEHRLAFWFFSTWQAEPGLAAGTPRFAALVSGG